MSLYSADSLHELGLQVHVYTARNDDDIVSSAKFHCTGDSLHELGLQVHVVTSRNDDDIVSSAKF
jgi:glycerophosphoryl diester phosphodiesterase